MADPLIPLLVPGKDFLRRVDWVLAEYGAPAEHPILPLIAQLGVLPGGALDVVVAARGVPKLRAGMATALVVALSSAEAITLRAGTGAGCDIPALALAAAHVGRRVLSAVEDFLLTEHPHRGAERIAGSVP